MVWIKINCPPNGTTKALCLNFLRAVGDLVGENYHDDYGGTRSTVYELIPAMKSVAKVHGVGLLCVDEIQVLSEAHSGGAAEMLNFFV